jgi:hypothetical protein
MAVGNREISGSGSTVQDSQIQQLKAILYLLREHLDHFEEVENRFEPFDRGVEKMKPEGRREGVLSDPLEDFLQSSSKIDQQVKDLIFVIVQGFFKSKADLISSVHLTKSANQALHFSIVLKEDNSANRMSIFEFFEWYNKLDINTRYPIHFQFVPAELMEKINKIRELNLERVAKSHSSGSA